MTADGFRRQSAALLRHPMLFLAAICVLLTGLTFGSQHSISGAGLISVSAVAWLICVLPMEDLLHKQGMNRFFRLLLEITVGAIFYFLSVSINTVPENAKALLVGIAGFLLLLLAAAALWLAGRLDWENGILLIFAAGFLLRLIYVLYTGCTVRQHDVHSFGDTGGHAGYIEYLYRYMKLPDFDVRTVDQFYHPPLHHLLAALWMRLLTGLGIGYAETCESIQMLTLFYSSVCMLLSYRIFRELKLKGLPLLIAFSIVAFHPTFIIFAGSINNDILSVTFILGAILFALRWYGMQKTPDAADYKKRSYTEILKLAACIGLGMMTKLSVYMIAPAVALLFLLVFVQAGKRRGRYIGQFFAFGALCVPTALWWEIRNLFAFGVSPTYVPYLGTDNAQYVGYMPFWKRLFDFGSGQLSVVYDQYEFYGGAYFEYNPTIGALKTAMFGELLNDKDYPQIQLLGPILFWLGTALALLGVVAMLFVLLRKKDGSALPDKRLRWFFGGAYITFFVLYYLFCFSYAHTCTMNVRYISPLIVIGALFIGLWMKEEGRWAKVRNICVAVLTGLFCLSSLTVYMLIAA